MKREGEEEAEANGRAENAKRARTDNDIDEDALRSSQATPVMETGSTHSDNTSPADKLSDADVADDNKDEESAAASNSCAICMRNETDGHVNLLPHRCTQCRADAWKVCASCEAALLSRECPLCRASYAPQIFHAVQDDTSLGNSLVFLKIYLISQDSVLVYDRSSSVMYFSLPKDTSLPKHEIEYVTCKLPMDASRIENGQFLFTNEVWNELEALEDGHDVVDIRHTLRTLTQVLASPDAILFSRYKMTELVDMIDTLVD